nr:hypothetical protein GCM10020093_061610 [Planobispora longispora]
MTQIKFYGRRDVWAPLRRELSDVVHGCLAEVWKLPRTSGSTASCCWTPTTCSARSGASAI